MNHVRRSMHYGRVCLLAALLPLGACAEPAEPAPGEGEDVATVEQKQVCADCEPDGGGGGGGGTSGDYPIITFWEDNDCGGSQVGWFSATNIPMKIPNASGSGWVNDEAKSVRLFNIPAGTVLRVYDSSVPDLTDDWSTIYVKRFVADLCVYSFQVTWDDVDHTVVRNHIRDGLDGKVSLVRVDNQ
ncbi:MAG TPA: hypothetical protein VFS43_15530 [Polyangiaceae bacterium]|nr:hypothetical protein [Polyangiaceae bacterium]